MFISLTDSNEPTIKEPEVPIQTQIYETSMTNDIAVKAIESFNKGDYKTAIELFGELSKEDKKALVGLGIAYYKMDDYDMASRYLEESLYYNENFAARKFLAFIYYKKDDLDGALASAEKGLSIQDDPELRSLYEKVQRESNTQQSFIKESAIHFKVFFDGYEHSGLSRKVLDILEDAYNSIGTEIFYFPQESVTVILYTEKDFFDITKGPEWSGGIYDGKIRVPIRGIEKKEEALKRMLRHEYTHALVHQITKQCPTWINEGLAEYFSGGSERTGQVIPLRALEGSFMDLGKDKVETAYKESYSAVSYLIERYGLLSIKHMLVSLGEGKDLNSAFEEAFSISYDEFVSTWGG